MSINLLPHAACVIRIINIDAPAVFCTPKQIDLQAFLLLQLSCCVRVLLLTSKCVSLYLLFMVEIRPFKTYTGVQK